MKRIVELGVLFAHALVQFRFCTRRKRRGETYAPIISNRIDRNCPCFLALESEKSLKNSQKTAGWNIRRGGDCPLFAKSAGNCRGRSQLFPSPRGKMGLSPSPRQFPNKKNGTVPLSQWPSPVPGEPGGIFPFATPCEQKGTVPSSPQPVIAYVLQPPPTVRPHLSPKKLSSCPYPLLNRSFSPPFKW